MSPSERSAVRSPRNRGLVAIVDDDRAAGEVLVEALQHRGFAPRWFDSGRALLDVLDETSFEVVLTDLRMPEMNGLELASSIAKITRTLPVVVITAFGSIRAAVDAMKRGAYDFLTKPYDLDLVALTLDRAVAHRRMQSELDRLRAERTGADDGILTRSPVMQRVRAMIQRVAEGDSTVLVHGESGTGKELVARAIHRRSARADGPFVAINCAALPEHLLESELFGHARGAFTDARAARNGLFARATGGTLLLDEIGEMPLAMQAKLLRVLEDRKVRPVGSDHEVPIDVRVVAATHRDLEAEVAAGRFREDLYFRIRVIDVLLPPLRARGGDVLLLASEFIRVAAARAGHGDITLSPRAAQLLEAYEWPGNVRELQNSIERAVALCEGTTLEAEDLPERIREANAAPSAFAMEKEAGIVALDEIERRYILHALRTLGGNKRLAAQMLGLDRSTLYRKLEQYGEHDRKSGDRR
jgi:two-component system response regulator HydG